MPWKIMNQLSFYDITIVHDTESQFMGSQEWEPLTMAIVYRAIRKCGVKFKMPGRGGNP